MKKPFGIKLICLWLVINVVFIVLAAISIFMSKATLMIPDVNKMETIQEAQWQQQKVTSVEEFNNYFNKSISNRKAYIVREWPFSILAIIFAVGLWKLRRLFLIGFIGYSLIMLLANIVELILFHTFLFSRLWGILTYIIVLCYLTRPKVKKQFK